MPPRSATDMLNRKMLSTNGCMAASAAFRIGKLAPQIKTTLTSDRSASQEREEDDGAIADREIDKTGHTLLPRNLQTVDA